MIRFVRDQLLEAADLNAALDEGGLTAPTGTGATPGPIRDKAMEWASPEEYGAVGDGVTDDTAAMQRAIEALASLGGGVIKLRRKRYLIDSGNLYVRQGVLIEGRNHIGAQRQTVDYTTLRYALILNPAFTVYVGANAGLNRLAVLRKGLTRPTTARQGYDMVKAFAGTAIKLGDGITGGSDCSLTNLFVMGFDWGLYLVGGSRMQIDNITGDNRNGLAISQCYDIPRIYRCHWWPFLTANTGGVSLTTYGIASVANSGGLFQITTAIDHPFIAGDVVNIGLCPSVPSLNNRWTVQSVSGRSIVLTGSTYVAGYTGDATLYGWANRRTGIGYRIEACDVPTFVDCFAYAYSTGFEIGREVPVGEEVDGNGLDDINYATITTLVSCSVDDNLTLADPLTIGVHLREGSVGTRWLGGFISSTARPILCATSSPNAIGGCSTFSAAVIGANPTATARVQLDYGALLLADCQLYNLTFTVADTARALILNGGDQRLMTITGSNAALQKVKRTATLTEDGTAVSVAAEHAFLVPNGTSYREAARIQGSGVLRVKTRGANGGRVDLERADGQTGAIFSLGGGTTPNVMLIGDPTNNPKAPLQISGPVVMPPLTYATRGSLAPTLSGFQFFTDGDSGQPCAAVWDGAVWRRIVLGPAISAT